MQTHYERLGGGEILRQLVDRFYDLMDEDPDYYGIRKLHPEDLTESRFGHPFLRRRHMPFVIGESERDQWMGCMVRAMQDVGVNEAMQKELTAAFFKTADFMRNQQQ